MSSRSSIRVGRAYESETGIGQTTCPGEPSTLGVSANPGGSAGNSCIGGSVIVRLSTGDGPSSFFGNWTGSIELPEAGSPGAFAVTPGSTWHFQLWFRQPGNPPTSNFSAGLAIAFD